MKELIKIAKELKDLHEDDIKLSAYEALDLATKIHMNKLMHTIYG